MLHLHTLIGTSFLSPSLSGDCQPTSDIPGSLFLPRGDSTSIVPFTTATSRRDAETPHLSPVAEAALLEYAESKTRAALWKTPKAQTPETNSGDQLYLSDSPIVVTRSPTLDLRELDVNFGEKKIPGTFNPLYFGVFHRAALVFDSAYSRSATSGTGDK